MHHPQDTIDGYDYDSDRGDPGHPSDEDEGDEDGDADYATLFGEEHEGYGLSFRDQTEHVVKLFNGEKIDLPGQVRCIPSKHPFIISLVFFFCRCLTVIVSVSNRSSGYLKLRFIRMSINGFNIFSSTVFREAVALDKEACYPSERGHLGSHKGADHRGN